MSGTTNRVSLVLSHVYLNSISNTSILGSVSPSKFLKESLAKDSNNLNEALGSTDQDKTEVESWVDQAAQAAAPNSSTFESFIQDLEKFLVPRTYIASKRLTAADVATYVAVYPFVTSATHSILLQHPCITRHFDLVQHTSPIVDILNGNTTAPSEITSIIKSFTINTDDVPAIERKAEPQKKDKKKKDNADGAAAAADNKKEEGGSNKKSEKKEKKEKKPKENAAPAAAPAGPPMPHMVDLRVGKIVEISKHPDADSLYVEKVDLGEGEPRTVVSGLVNYVPIEQMQNRDVVAVCNLKPASMRGIKSHAMLLCASHKDGKDGGVEPCLPPEGSKPGDKLVFEGFESEQPLEQLNPKKKIFETVQPGFITLEDRKAAWVNPESKSVHVIKSATNGNIVHAPSFVGASLS